MKFGIFPLLGGPAATPEFISGLGPAVEERGFHSLWAAEHVVLFDQQDSKYPYSSDGVPPFNPDDNFLEPFSALSFIAATTTKLRLGTGICILPQRNPVYTAKQVTDLDILSGGRFDFGIGVGWLKEEFDALGVPFDHRGARANECIDIARTLWSDGVSQYNGKFYTLPECHQYPKPVQKPHPPIYVGGESWAALRRVAEYGDGWFGFNILPDRVLQGFDMLQPLLAEHGRTMVEMEIFASPYTTPCTLDMVKQYQDAHVDQIILLAASANLDDLKRELDSLSSELLEPAKGL
ncbi:MAG: LLM class F420-dependent oxidoreductase [Rhodospirillales bacterium]|nr:LLM class F420-dependent oxidoreductase [Rhodospirillales bacterium]